VIAALVVETDAARRFVDIVDDLDRVDAGVGRIKAAWRVDLGLGCRVCPASPITAGTELDITHRGEEVVFNAVVDIKGHDQA